ncbi:uncharacterized protein LOC107633457 [Arachis ipaensis]|uniref:uncharacterized protein LOC107633457 n=1 Tax=Arachis ipaensis TaxID=130454 RepID=UPI0007AF0AA3|nr:uncharacterized protein LOC107633457 [Arachis ipaensis]XP_025640577.1 uncharacterized protein LOC112735230 [Arachis hypogaea]
MDAYSSYNQILTHETDQDKTAFITYNGNFCYKVMPFGLKNASATYQRLMDKIFINQIGRNIDVYVNDMVAKSTHTANHVNDLTEILQQLRRYNMKLNPEKCAFGVQSGKFLGFMLTWRGKKQHPIYFVSKTLQNTEVRYPKLEKLALALVTTARRLRHYFQSHTIVVRTEQPLRQILTKPELAGRLIKWSIELSEYDIQYESRGAIKSQALSDFIAELTLDEKDPKDNIWTLYVNGASNSKGSGAGILLKDEHGIAIEQSLQFTFHARNNQAEYEALIAGLRLAHTMGITQLNVKCDSLLVVQQVTVNFQVKDTLLEKYNTIFNNLVNNFQKFHISHTPREQNDRADILSKLATTRSQSTTPILSQLTLNEPSVMLTTISSISRKDDWRSPFITYLQTGSIPSNVQNQRKFKRQASFYTILGTELYKRGFTRPLLRCLNTAEAKLAIDEVHEGVCGTHIGSRSLAAKILRSGYYWPMLQQDCMNKVKHYDHCQRDAQIIHNPADQLHTSEICWPFNKWGLDIIGPFPPAPGQKLEDSKGEWAELIPEVLWSYNTTKQSSTRETPFRLVYGCDAMIPVEVSLQNTRTTNVNKSDHIKNRRTELDLIEENRDKSALHQLVAKRAITRKYNKKLKPRTFSEEDLVLRRIEDIRKPQGHGKLSTTWDYPFRIQKVIGKGAYKIQKLDGTILPNTWNTSSLKMYFS